MTYQYVYGEWNELFELLSEGEVDILCGVPYSFARKYTNVFFTETYGYGGILYICKDDRRHNSGQYKEFR